MRLRNSSSELAAKTTQVTGKLEVRARRKGIRSLEEEVFESTRSCVELTGSAQSYSTVDEVNPRRTVTTGLTIYSLS